LIGDKVFIIEISGCEWGGVEDVAFSTREKAEQWVAEQEADDEYPKLVVCYETKEVVIQ
jgi:hypothetical protein